MKRTYLILFICFCFCIFFINCSSSYPQESTPQSSESIQLPQPRTKGNVSVEDAIFKRKSIRNYKNAPLNLNEISQILWAAAGKTVDGITGATRAYPSAGGIYPLEVYLVAGNVEGLPAGIYQYDWRGHTLKRIKEGDHRDTLSRAALRQRMIANAPVSLIFTADYNRTTSRYGKRGEKYVYMDVGGAGQNVHLQAESLGLGTVIVGAFNDNEVKSIIGVEDEEPLYIMPVGKK